MLKGLSVGKTFTTTVRQVTPFYDWQTSFPHSAVRANAAAPEPKAVTEGKEGGRGLEGMEVCLSFKRVCAIKFTFAFACAARLLRPFSHGARKYATIFLIKRSTGCQNAVVCNFRQTVSTCVCVWMCICVSECVSLGVLAKLPWLFLLHTRHSLSAHSSAYICMLMSVATPPVRPCPALCQVRAARITLLITKLNMNAFWYQTENREAAQT